MTPADLAERIRGRGAEVLLARDEVTWIVDREALLGVLASLRDDPELSFDFLSCVTAVDRLDAEPRFWVVYELRSMLQHHRLRLKVGVPAADPTIPSITPMFPTANFQEREVFDLYGIVFEDHPDLTRILMPEGWMGYPLRKDEELGGVNTRYQGAFIPPVDRRTTT